MNEFLLKMLPQFLKIDARCECVKCKMTIVIPNYILLLIVFSLLLVL